MTTTLLSVSKVGGSQQLLVTGQSSFQKFSVLLGQYTTACNFQFTVYNLLFFSAVYN